MTEVFFSILDEYHDELSLNEKVLLYAEKFQRKFKKSPTQCFINTKHLSEKRKVGEISMIPDSNVPRRYFWYT